MIKKTDTYINNRKARYNYYIEDSYTAGIVLKGSEVKALRDGKASIVEAYCYISDHEVWLKNALISSPQNNTMFGHIENRDRKLLLKKKEINKLEKYIAIKGYTLIPIKIHIPVKGFIKVEVAICIGKHNYDKRNTIKERDFQRYEKTY